ncbi:hypothetical protein CQ047_14265 [Microbacterium sp. MYb72]|uniref:hypothetical protein n=1 Tax=Microbacterium sp. MYb72 TaxID=1848693 RepID=UPI000CFCF6C6|nr:hypothetical protein [Microbacterium sp. MYb72]PRB07126.1 hypothetical protein CQ047_14265 [Microbacterium sp. MYb72]
MSGFERRTITIDRRDQRAVLGGHVRQSRRVFVLLGVVVVLFAVAAGLSALDGSPSSAWGIAGGSVCLVVVLVTLLIGNQALMVRRQLPLGAEFSLTVSDDTLDIDGPGGADRIRWRQLSNLTRVGGGVYVTIAPSNARLGLPGRLIGDDALAQAVESIRLADGVGGRADASARASAPASAVADAVPSAPALSASIVFTAGDQRVARAALLRRSGPLLAVFGVLGAVGIAGLAAGATGILPRDTMGFLAVVTALAVVCLIVLVVAVSRAVSRTLALGTAQTLTLAPDALELTGPGGETRLLWNQLSGLRRAGGAVTVKTAPSRTTLLFVGRLIDDEMYAAIEQRIESAQRSGVDSHRV